MRWCAGFRFAATAALLLFAPPAPILAQPEGSAHGLAWNRSGLPAVFPLQVITRDGQDLFLTLEDADTGKAVMGANIEGGRFFKLLVPPGTYRLRFDPAGDSGATQGSLLLPEPLTFEILGEGKKTGHLVDISGLSADHPENAEIRPQSICQVLEQDFEPRFPGLEFDEFGKQLPNRPRGWSEYLQTSVRAFYCD